MTNGTETLIQLLSTVGLGSWVVQVFVVVLATALLAFASSRLVARLHPTLKRTPSVWDESFVEALGPPLRVFLWVAGIAFAIEIIQNEVGATIFEAVDPIRDVGLIAAVAWFPVRFIRIAEVNFIADREAKGEEVDRATLDAIVKLLRLSVMITAFLVALQTLGFSVSGVLAFGGIGGIAVGFAAKDLLANFFGGLMIYLDRPFAIGDWIRSPDRQIEGTVERIGWRLTVIRGFDTRPLYIPNSAFANIAVENPSRMRNRRIYETIGIRYDDVAKMGAIVADVESMLRTHADIDADKFLMVNFDAFAPSSLDFFVYCYTRTTGWAQFHQVKQDVLLRIADIIAGHGAEIAFPTSTVHLAGDIPQVGENAADPRSREEPPPDAG
ncbi:MAG: mechanosensitive ion channel family protein [Rhodospirillales bacterium]|nr:mechanosensitive ion channel family protein [Rhodospirillales bacterium]